MYVKSLPNCIQIQAHTPNITPKQYEIFLPSFVFNFSIIKDVTKLLKYIIKGIIAKDVAGIFNDICKYKGT